MKAVFSSFTDFVDGQTNLKDLIKNMENKQLSSNATRRRITEMYKRDSNNSEKSASVPKKYNEIMLAMNSPCDILLHDMEENYDINVQETVQLIKEYADDISQSYKGNINKIKICKNNQMTKLDLNEYTDNLKSLNNRIVRFNLNKVDTSCSKRSMEVEARFSTLSEELDLFNKVIIHYYSTYCSL